MHHRVILAGLAATGGLLTTAFLQVAVAAADVSADGADAFTIGNYTFDPFTVPLVNGSEGAELGFAPSGIETEGFAAVGPLSSAPPLLTLGGGVTGAVSSAPQYLEVYSPSGTDLGSIDAGESVTNLAGLTNTEFTVNDVFPASGEADSALPTVGSVYDSFNLGNGYDNVYTAIPSTSGGADTVTDTLVTPYGNVNLDSLFGSIDAVAPLQPGDAFTGLADSAVAQDAFTIGGYTLDPVSDTGPTATEGFTPVVSNAGAAPLLNIGGLSLYDPSVAGDSFDNQDFTVYDGTGSNASDVGTITTGEDVTNLLGYTNTELVVTGSTAASGDTSSQAADLPATGTVLDAFNLGNGYENVYTATPGLSGTVTDTLVTPYGDTNLDSLFGSINAAGPLGPGAAFTGLEGGDSSISSDAFSIGDTTFDPVLTDQVTGLPSGGEGYDPVYQVVGAPPLLNLGGGILDLEGLPWPLGEQDFNVYDGTGATATEVGNITTYDGVTNLLGLTNTEFTVEAVTAASGADPTDLPSVGSVYDVFNLGDGIENVYTAIPGVDGAPDTVTDTLVTPWGDLNLDSLVAGIDGA
ncbi:MAG: hypothetical protein QOG14_5386, partial [Mycobacterium sp.]|nr:hypothetical protein [Mycobacterium sp.]